jgi:hypothetical protein
MVAGMGDGVVRERLQLALREALRTRDTIAASALRSALAAIDNAQAVPPRPQVPAARMSRALPWVLARERLSGAASVNPKPSGSCGRRSPNVAPRLVTMSGWGTLARPAGCAMRQVF